ncbi:MAG: aspartyl protease family protein [Acidobacteria bacterium]|nr:aspartyl protease family protein [Acidobacteriota bacterium]
MSKILVDTGSEYTWLPARLLERLGIAREKKDVRFVMANGQEVTRSVGFAIVRHQSFFTIDEVVFGEPGDLELLGARTLEGLNLQVDPQRRKLVAAGPVPAAPNHPRRGDRRDADCLTHLSRESDNNRSRRLRPSPARPPRRF